MLPYLRLPKTSVVNFTSFKQNSFTRIRFSLFLFFSFAAVWAQSQTIGTVTRFPNPVCAGSDISISFFVTNGNGTPTFFDASTNYLVFLSNSTGSDFTQIASFTSTTAPASSNGATALITEPITIPSGTAFGTGYQISVGSTSPDFDGSTGANASGAFTVNAPTATFTKTFVSCQGDDGSISLTPTNGTAPFSFSWTGPNGFTSIDQNITSLATGDYTVVIQDANTCTGTINGITIGIAKPLSVGVKSKSNPGDCNATSGSITVFRIGGVNDGITPIQYRLDGPVTVSFQTSNVFTGLSAGDYTATVQDSKGCPGVSSTITLTQAATLAFTNVYVTNVSSCGNDSDGSIKVTVTGGVAPYHYIVDEAEDTVKSRTVHTFDSLPAGPHTVMVTDNAGCSILKDTTIGTATDPVAGRIYKSNVSCPGAADGSISIGGVTGGIPPYQYSINGNFFQSSNSFTNLSKGTYDVVIRDAKRCTSVPVPVTIEPAIVACIASGNVNINSTFNIDNSTLKVLAMPNPAKTEAGMYIAQVMQGKDIQTIKLIKGN